MTEAYIINTVRTPRGTGKMGTGALSQMHPEHLSATVLAAIKERNPIDTADVDDVIDHEEYPRPDTTLQSLAQLKPAFEMFYNMPSAPGGKTYVELINQVCPEIEIKPIHHVGISSGVVDGAPAILLASAEYADKHGLKPRARVVAMAETGDCPTLMLNGPGPAAKKVLANAGLSKDDIDVWEVNEAFAAVVEKFIRDLDFDRAKLNPNGGSIALGHLIAGSGAILIGTTLDDLERTGGRYGLVTMCAAGGMAPAIIIERI